MFWLEGGLNHKLLGESQLSYPLDYRVLLIKTKHFICIYITYNKWAKDKKTVSHRRISLRWVITPGYYYYLMVLNETILEQGICFRWKLAKKIPKQVWPYNRDHYGQALPLPIFPISMISRYSKWFTLFIMIYIVHCDFLCAL